MAADNKPELFKAAATVVEAEISSPSNSLRKRTLKSPPLLAPPPPRALAGLVSLFSFLGGETLRSKDPPASAEFKVRVGMNLSENEVVYLC